MSLQTELLRLLMEQPEVRTHELLAKPIVAACERTLRAAHMVEIEPGTWIPTAATGDWIERMTARDDVEVARAKP